MRALDLIAWTLLVLPFTGLLAARYLWGIFHSDRARPRSTLLGFMALAVVIGEIDAIMIGPLAVTYVTGITILSAEQTGLALGIALVAGIVLPQLFALLVWVLRRWG